jgi:hypothetical protein
MVMGLSSQNVLFEVLSDRQVAFDSEILNKLNTGVRQDEDQLSGNSRLARFVTGRGNEHKSTTQADWDIWRGEVRLAGWINDCIDARHGPEDVASMTLGMG